MATLSPPAPGSEPLFSFRSRLRRLLRELVRPERRFWVLVAVVGLISGLGAVVLLKVLRFTQHLFWSSDAEGFLPGVLAAPSWRRFLVPVLAGALVSLVSLLIGQPLRGHGTAGIIESIWVKSGRLPLPRALLRGFISIIAVALGAPLGREGALLQTGAASGSSLARWLRLGPGQARLLVACGAAAGTTHAPVSAVLIIFELTGDYGLILPLMLGAFLSTVISRRLEPESLYTSVLNRRNVRIPATVPNWLRQEGPRALLTPVPHRVSPSASFQEVVVLLLEQPSGMDLYVTDEEGRYLGTIALDALKGHLPDHSLLGATIAADVMDRHLQPITPDLSLAEVATRFAQTPLERLPVVDLDRRLLGTISKSDVLKRGRF